MIQARNSYNAVKANYDKIAQRQAIKKGMSKEEASKKVRSNVRLTQSSLILMKAITPSSNVYKFSILENDNASPPFPEEIRLNLNDEFTSYEMGYYLVAGTILEGDPDLDEGKEFFTYAPMELNSSFVAVQKGWNGVVDIEVNKINRLDNWDLKKHNFVPRTQFQSAGAVLPSATQPSMDFAENGTYPMQPMLVLSGSKKTKIGVTLNGGSIPDTTAGTWSVEDGGQITYTFKFIALTFRGLLGQNASKFQ